MTNPFSGTTAECLKHFVESNPAINKREDRKFKTRDAISDLLGIDSVTGYKWFTKFSLPKGENLLRLRYFLSLNGYKPSDAKEVPDWLKELSDQLSLGVVSISFIAAHVNGKTPDLVSLLMGQRGTSESRRNKLKELVEANRQKAKERLKSWQKKMEPYGFIKLKDQTKELPVKEVKVTKLTNGQIIETLAHLILASKPLAERILSDDFSAEDRRKLRELTANGRSSTLFDLANLLNRLCGERARNEL